MVCVCGVAREVPAQPAGRVWTQAFSFLLTSLAQATGSRHHPLATLELGETGTAPRHISQVSPVFKWSGSCTPSPLTTFFYFLSCCCWRKYTSLRRYLFSHSLSSSLVIHSQIHTTHSHTITQPADLIIPNHRKRSLVTVILAHQRRLVNAVY